MRSAADVPTRRVIPMRPAPPYGMELVMDLHDCDHTLFNREALATYFKRLCDLIGMEREDLHFWDYDGWEPLRIGELPPHLKATSAVQFIKTSSVVVHTLDDLHRVYVNIFSCREFSVAKAVAMTTEYFGTGWCGHRVFERS